MSDYIFNKNELEKDLEELHNLESQPNVESDSILYERLVHLTLKVDKARQYLMDSTVDIDWNMFDWEIKSTIKHIKNLSKEEQDFYIGILADKISEHGFDITNEDLLKHMYYLEFFEGLD